MLLCGNGIMYRIRNCFNFVFWYWGENCLKFGLVEEIRVCNEYFCLIYGGYM